VKPDLIVASALAYLREHARDPCLRLSAVAQLVHVPPRTLSRNLNGRLKKKFRVLVHDQRCWQGAELLKTTTLSIKEIAVSLGYPSTSPFDLEFKARFGITPKQYRAAIERHPK